MWQKSILWMSAGGVSSATPGDDKCGCFVLKISGAVGAYRCYKVLSQRKQDQLMEVLTAFNVIVTQSDVLSRCQVSGGVL